MKKVMVRAWEIARAAVKKFGGSVKSFFAQSLKMAWAEIKGVIKVDVKMKNMVEESIIKLMAPYTVEQVAMMKNTVDEIASDILVKAEQIRPACTCDKAALQMAVLDGLYADDKRKRGMAMMILKNI